MIVSTTPTFEGHTITNYLGVVTGEVLTGVDFIRDIGAGLRNVFGGRSAGYENELIEARQNALNEMVQRAEAMGANAVVAVDFDYEAFGQGNMIMVAASGTAVIVS